MLGDILGFYPIGLDYLIVLNDYTQIKMEAEEDPGLIYDLKKHIAPSSFEITLINPELTDIPAEYSHAGLTNSEKKIIWNHRLNEIHKILKIKEYANQTGDDNSE